MKEKFEPIDVNNVKVYVCGPTVYDLIHIGNARSQIVYDVLYRTLIYLYGKEKVTYVQNITDIDDKIIVQAKKKNITTQELTQQTIQNFLQDYQYLNCLTPSYMPRATQNIDSIIQMIQVLLDKKYAYVNQGCVYFDVSKVKNYHTLCKNSNTDMLPLPDFSDQKKDLKDFSLWKKGKVDENVKDLFDSPWSLGRPGWHIECSAMIWKTLGNKIDIHAGGVDLKFPHHTNEIAQSTCALNTDFLAKFWLHNELLIVDGKKMSKSLGNTLTIRDLVKNNIGSSVFRSFILNTHYRKQINFSKKSIEDAQKKISYIKSAKRLAQLADQDSNHIKTKPCKEFLEHILNDLNTHEALEYVMSLAKKIHKGLDMQNNAIKMVNCANFLSLFDNDKMQSKTYSKISAKQINLLINQRNVAKKNKNWQLADEIRDELTKKGIILKDKADGTTYWQT